MLRFCDGFDHYPTADIIKKWSSLQADASSVYPSIGAFGRYGSTTGCLVLGGGSGGVIKFVDNLNSWLVGFAFRTNTSSANLPQLIQWYSTDNQQQIQISLVNGTLKYLTGQNATFNGAASIGIAANTWYYIELAVQFQSSCSANSNVLRLNGNPVITVPTGTDTRGASNTANTNANQLRIGCSGYAAGSQTVYIDDFYLCDTTGSTNNALLGDVRIETLYPNGAGTSTQFAPSSGTNWGCVSEVTEDGDSSYVASSTPGQKDVYTIGPLSTTPINVYGVQMCATARKDDAGGRTIASIIHSGGTDYDHASTNPFSLGDGYGFGLDIWEANPNGSVAWTGTTINSMDIGVKVVS